jgi:hypothetical protein
MRSRLDVDVGAIEGEGKVAVEGVWWLGHCDGESCGRSRMMK